MGGGDMNYLINIWNGLAVTVFTLTAFVFLYLVYIYSKEDSGYWCVEMPSDPKPPAFPSDLTKALWMGLAFFLVSAIFTSLFSWWIGEPETGTFIAAFLLIILFFPDEIADFSGQVVYVCWGMAEKLKLRGEEALCAECRVPLQPTDNHLLPVQYFGGKKIKGQKEFKCPICDSVSYR